MLKGSVGAIPASSSRAWRWSAPSASRSPTRPGRGCAIRAAQEVQRSRRFRAMYDAHQPDQDLLGGAPSSPPPEYTPPRDPQGWPGSRTSCGSRASARSPPTPGMARAAELLADELRRAGGDVEVRATRHALVLGDLRRASSGDPRARVVLRPQDVQPPGPRAGQPAPRAGGARRRPLRARGGGDKGASLFMLVAVQRHGRRRRAAGAAAFVIGGEEEAGAAPPHGALHRRRRANTGRRSSTAP